MFKGLKSKNNDIHYNFTSILSSNNVKFSDFRFQEHMSKYLDMDYYKISYFSNIIFSNIIHLNKTYIKQLTKTDKTTQTKKKIRKKEREEIFKNKYYRSDLFEFIRHNNLDHKSIDKLCKISAMDSMWSDNDIITDFTNNIDSMIEKDKKEQKKEL